MLKKMDRKNLVEYESYFYTVLSFKWYSMWVKWVSEMWDSINIYSINELILLFVDRLNEKTELLFADKESIS